MNSQREQVRSRNGEDRETNLDVEKRTKGEESEKACVDTMYASSTVALESFIVSRRRVAQSRYSDAGCSFGNGSFNTMMHGVDESGSWRCGMAVTPLALRDPPTRLRSLFRGVTPKLTASF